MSQAATASEHEQESGPPSNMPQTEPTVHHVTPRELLLPTIDVTTRDNGSETHSKQN